jgi:hypothetical protein
MHIFNSDRGDKRLGVIFIIAGIAVAFSLLFRKRKRDPEPSVSIANGPIGVSPTQGNGADLSMNVRNEKAHIKTIEMIAGWSSVVIQGIGVLIWSIIGKPDIFVFTLPIGIGLSLVQMFMSMKRLKR